MGLRSIAERARGVEEGVLHLIIFDVRDGRTSEIPLRFLELSGRPHVLHSKSAEPKWVSTVRSSPVNRWRIGDEAFAGTSHAVDDIGIFQTEILPAFASRFGIERLLRWFGPEVGCVEFSGSTDLNAYYGQVETLFDRAAPDYDRLVQGDRLNLHLRNVSARMLSGLFPPGSRVLEIGCGTGLETLPLARSGVDLVVVDISAKMLEELDRKARAETIRNRIEIRKGRACDLSVIAREFGPASFDGAFSHFGALNCEPNLAAVPEALYQLIKPAGKLSLGTLNRTSLAELVLFTAIGRPSRAFARLQSSMPVAQSSSGVVEVFPRAAMEMQTVFRPYFSLEDEIGVSIFVPPPQFGRRFRQQAALVSLLEAIDRHIARWPLFRHLGDYVMMKFRRN